MSIMAQKFSVKQTLKITDFKTSAMLDYLARTEIVVPSLAAYLGRGRKRYYTFPDLIILKIVKRILDQGIPVKRLKVALSEFRKKQLSRVIADPAGARFLIVSGESLYFCKTASEIMDLNAGGQLVFGFMLDTQQIHTEVRDAVAIQMAKAA